MFLLAWLYGCIVSFRNWLFDIDVLHTTSFAHPIIGVGNLTVGGTGKTPHTELLVRMMLEEGFSVATLSRGYKRKTHGFRLATKDSTASDIGDEPLQIATLFPDITVAVDENRVRGIRTLMQDAKPDVIILDDAFQHRYVRPGKNILLIDYNRPPFSDRLLPSGRLRESFDGRKRADMVIVTKCPSSLSPIDYRVFEEQLRLMPFQKLFFTSMVYADLQPLFTDAPQLPLKKLRDYDRALLITGIANPDRLHQDLIPLCQRITLLSYPDHHAFTPSDVERINTIFHDLPADERIIITTSKDAMRLRLVAQSLSEEVRQAIHVLPMQVRFLRDEQRTFQRIITDYVVQTKKENNQ
ncbi:MAG: tetraacyldisaccharide 4'-kinase [Bacteroidaceae bacterium]|nr:tetraacyldisaccharide 4'-kinase [Bacteroidaceae bacterium]